MVGTEDATVRDDAGTAVGTVGRRSRRRSFLVNRRYQLRAAALVATVVLVLLIFLNLSLYSAGVDRSEALLQDSPELTRYVQAQDRVMVFLVVLGSAVFLVGVFLVSVLETHKTAGACVNLTQRLAEIRDGRYDTVLALRRDDQLKELEPAFNDMCRALQQRTWDDVEALEELASKLERREVPAEPGPLAADLRALAARKRRRVE